MSRSSPATVSSSVSSTGGSRTSFLPSRLGCPPPRVPSPDWCGRWRPPYGRRAYRSSSIWTSRVLSGVSHQSGQVMPCALPAHYVSGRYPGFPTGEGLSDTGEGGGGLRRRGLAQAVEGAPGTVLVGPVRTPGESSGTSSVARINMRPLQFHLLAFRPASRDLTIPIPPAPHLEETFRWWCDAANLTRGVPFPPAPPSLVLTTDASLRGWGAYTKAASLAHVWEESLRGTHINVLELLAVYRALSLLGQETYGRVILVRCDNRAVSYINRQGGTIRAGRGPWHYGPLHGRSFGGVHCTRSSYGRSTCRGPRTPSRTLSPASTRLRRSGPFTNG